MYVQNARRLMKSDYNHYVLSDWLFYFGESRDNISIRYTVKHQVYRKTPIGVGVQVTFLLRIP